MSASTRESFEIAGHQIKPGRRKDIRIKISETYTGDDISIPLRVIHGVEPGPVVFVCAAIHGDEINGTGIIHELMFARPLRVKAGTLLLIPVVNVFGFESHDRYLPDRRDLNRVFPGSENGSLSSRIAHRFMHEIVSKCDYGIDLHSAAFQRTNFPNVRADLKQAGVRKLATAFGCSLIVDGKGPEGSLRREACNAGCPTIILEAGEPWKMEPAIMDLGVQGVKNVLCSLGMILGAPVMPPYQTRVSDTTWVRASVGGILKFHVSAGELVEKDQPIATNYSMMGKEQNILTSPVAGLVLGITTMPAVKPGEPVCHIAIPTKSLQSIREALKGSQKSLDHRIRKDLATNIDVVRRSKIISSAQELPS